LITIINYHQLLAAKYMHFYTFYGLNPFSWFMRRHLSNQTTFLMILCSKTITLKHTDKASVTHVMCRLCTSLGCISAKKLPGFAREIW